MKKNNINMKRLIVIMIALTVGINTRTNGNNKFIHTPTPTDSLLTILTYGLPLFDEYNSRETVARKFGFRTIAVAGCVVTQELIDSVKKENKWVYQQLARRWGPNWETNYEQQARQWAAEQEKVAALVRKQSFIQAKDKALNSDYTTLRLQILPGTSHHTYQVKAYAWGKENGKEATWVYFTLKADMNTHTVTVLNDQLTAMD
ncbi:hypothetical protein KTO58_16300 [Chitinophaga pendula]|uniref:FEKKY domain-containing protein n=1 Tax=Chitinophaga TaxID=79328 RepID=UPI000BB05B2D|nr:MULTISPECIES: hypothetical protein [Chitinophaga]ASZ11726.1 hypothetical protein CK934_12545 [Chitinophaga sp. MD30]UCJ05254.1 hypothetical protein KTO58_16300 [Chitinophaga pendula]